MAVFFSNKSNLLQFSDNDAESWGAKGLHGALACVFASCAYEWAETKIHKCSGGVNYKQCLKKHSKQSHPHAFPRPGRCRELDEKEPAATQPGEGRSDTG